MRRSIVPLIERAVLIALAPACGTSIASQLDGGADAGGDATLDTTDAPADGASDDASIDVPTLTLPLPDGCIVSGKPDAFAPCGYTEQLNDPVACGVELDAGIQEAGVCFVLCDPTEPDCVFYELNQGGDAGTAALVTCGAGCIGRLHPTARGDGCCEGLQQTGAYLARAAMLEAASIDAFVEVASVLRRFGAPSELVRDARCAARDELRHARAVGRLARRFDREPPPPPRPRARRATLRSFALENAIEGCVRETYGAALAGWQAARARDAEVRDVMGTIAGDEARHADLGWRIDAWAMSRLAPHHRDAIAAARRRAVSDLETSLESSARDDVLGLPGHEEAKNLIAALREGIWNA